jgi:hypothetical protein
VSEAWVTYIAEGEHDWPEIDGVGDAEPAAGEAKTPDGSSYVVDERTGLLLPEGARAKRRTPGFGAEWDE